jgi:hypothetical protein
MQSTNEIGNRYGRLLVVARAKNNEYGQACWLCQCDCGGEPITVAGYSLRQKNTESRGCLRSETTAKKNVANRTHGAKLTPEYAAYMSAKGRCNNPRNRSYKDYGGRGIKFLFTSFEQWFGEIGPRPSPHHSHDRIENDGNYEPGNVQWATKKYQANNRRAYHETLIRQITALKARVAELEAMCPLDTLIEVR